MLVHPTNNRVTVTRRPLTGDELARVEPRFPWGELALAPLSGLLAAVPAVVLGGLPLYVALWLADVDAPAGWAAFLGVAVFAVAAIAALASAIGAYLRLRERLREDLEDGEVEERVVEVNEAIGVVTDPPVIYLRFIDGDTVTLRGDYVAELSGQGQVPSTALRLAQLPRSRAVAGAYGVGQPLLAAFVSGVDHTPTELDGHPADVDFERLRAKAT